MIESLPSVVTRIIIAENSGADDEFLRLLDLQTADSRIASILRIPNRGFGDGMNCIARSENGRRGDIVWLMNPDATVTAFASEAFQRQLQSNQNAIYSPLIAGGDGREDATWFDGGSVDIAAGRCEHTNYSASVRPGTECIPTDYVTGAAPIMPRAVFDSIGGFDERLFLYWEDVELSLQAQRLGISQYVTGAVRVLHIEGGTADVPKGAVYRYFMARNRVWVCVSEGTYRRWTSGLRESAREVARSLRGPGHGRMTRLKATAKGTVDGYRGASGYASGERSGLQGGNSALSVL